MVEVNGTLSTNSPADAVPDVRHAGRLDCSNLLDLEVADVLEQPLAGAEHDRNDVQTTFRPGGRTTLIAPLVTAR